jgi:hypothetical protein
VARPVVVFDGIYTSGLPYTIEDITKSDGIQ